MGEQIRCAHILVEKQSTALEIIQKLKNGESFATLAAQYGLDSTRKHGGDLGRFGRGMMVKEFEDAAFALKPGQITEQPIRTQFGYHVIKRLE